MSDELRPNSRRIEGFSDGVFAVAVTIIVLEVRVPDSLAFANDVAALGQFATLLAIYALTFVVVGILWANHHYLITTLASSDRATLWLNNHVLFGLRWCPLSPDFWPAPNLAQGDGCLCFCRDDVHRFPNVAETSRVANECQSISPRNSPSSVPKSVDRDCSVCRSYPSGICRCEAKLGTSHYPTRYVLSPDRSRGCHQSLMAAFHSKLPLA